MTDEVEYSTVRVQSHISWQMCAVKYRKIKSFMRDLLDNI